jgi:hypothetical protein
MDGILATRHDRRDPPSAPRIAIHDAILASGRVGQVDYKLIKFIRRKHLSESRALERGAASDSWQVRRPYFPHRSKRRSIESSSFAMFSVATAIRCTSSP